MLFMGKIWLSWLEKLLLLKLPLFNNVLYEFGIGQGLPSSDCDMKLLLYNWYKVYQLQSVKKPTIYQGQFQSLFSIYYVAVIKLVSIGPMCHSIH